METFGLCMGFSDVLKEKIPADKLVQLCQNGTKSFDYDGVSMGQFVDGVDVFYKDFRNKNLEVGFALTYVRDQVKGKTPAELEKELTEFRNAQASSGK